MKRLLFIANLSLFAFGGCATAPGQQVVVMDPLVLTADKTGNVAMVEVRSLFKAATLDYQERRYSAAAEKFTRLTRLFSKSSYAPHAFFNAGLSYMKLKRFDSALAQFAKARAGLKDTEDKWDVLLQIAKCHEVLKQWHKAAKALRAVLKSPALAIVDRIEIRIRLGVALYETHELALAERNFKKALKQARQHNDIPRLNKNTYVSQAQYLTGEIYRDLFRSIRFKLPVERMKRDLLDKSAFFLKSQSGFLRCIRLHHPQYSVASGFQLGKLYEQMYDDMMAAEIPNDLDADDKKIYFEELKTHIKPLVLRAIDIYERNLSMSDRLGAGAEWARKTQVSLERMRTILRREFMAPEPSPKP